MPLDPAIAGIVGAAVGGSIGVLGSYILGRQAADTAKTVAFEGWQREVRREAFEATVAAIELGRRLFYLRRQPTPEEMLEFSRGIVPPLLRGRAAFGLETSDDVKRELLEAVADVLAILNEGGVARDETRRLSEVVYRNANEITGAWERVLARSN